MVTQYYLRDRIWNMPNVNPDILNWARETAGFSPEDAVNKLGINDAYGIDATTRLLAQESGKVAHRARCSSRWQGIIGDRYSFSI